MQRNGRRKVIVMILVAVILVSITISFAYFVTVVNNDRAQTAVLKTGTMSLTFEDNDNGINKRLAFGESVIKRFKITNTGSLDASLSLDWNNFINTYLNGSLSYNLSYATDESIPDSDYEEIIPETNMPTSDKPISQAVASELSVPAGEVYYYNLKITLNYLADVNQDDDLDAVFSTNFDVGEPSRYRYYKLSVDPNGGSWGEYTSTQEYLLKNKETMTISGTPTRAGYTFAGWRVIGASSTLTDGTFTMGISDTVLRAEWTPNTYSLTLDLAGGTISGSTTMDVKYRTPAEIETPTREGYTFTGWTPVGGTIEGNKFTLTSMDGGSLTATWKANNYKYIVYHNKQNINDDGYTLVEADTNEGEAEFGRTVTPEVKTYTGFTSPSATGLTIKAETAYPPVLNKVEYNYNRNSYTLTINPDGGSYTGSTSQTLRYEQSITLETPTKTGYNFTNWSNGSNVLTDSLFTMGTSDSTVTANYTAKDVSIEFNANGGTTTTASKTVKFNSTYGDLPTPTYEGYRFVGWYTALSGGNQVTSSTEVKSEGPITLYAHWVKNAGTDATLSALNIGKKTGNPTFTTNATKDETSTGLYSLEDDYGTSYYYRGAVTNNYVKFGGFYWRIIRINGDGSVRMIYDGTQAWPNGKGSSSFTISGTNRFTHTGQPWNTTNCNDAKYVGYMYGGSNGSASTQKDGTTSTSATYNQTSSNVKTQVDTWYKTNIADKGLSKYVSDEIFCNDRSMGGSDSTYTNLGYGTNPTNYAARGRFRSDAPGYVDATPTFKCKQKNDAFTVSDTEKGNGDLTYPVGLITADEIVAAGSGKAYTTNRYYYLYKTSGYWYWSLSPADFSGSRAYVSVVNDDGNLNAAGVHGTSGAVAPVINLSADYAAILTGTGIATDPYKIPDVQ